MEGKAMATAALIMGVRALVRLATISAGILIEAFLPSSLPSRPMTSRLSFSI
jgi:hypothetical protein